MEDIISKPPGLPRNNPTTAYWQSPPDDIAELRATSALPDTVDIIIVGSGISGATIAYNLLLQQPDLTIVMLEARQAASGASGRNGGHTKHASYTKFEDDIKKVGVNDAIKIAKLEYDCMNAVHSFIKKHNIDCDGHQCDTVDVYYEEGKFHSAQKSVKSMKKHIGEDDPVTHYEIYDAKETAERYLTPNSFGSLLYKAGSLSAYKFTIGVLKLALEKGLNLQCNTPVTSIARPASQSMHWTVDTSRGRITASKVVLATNGYTAHLYPEVQGTIIPFRGIVTAHRPGSNMPQTGLDVTYSFSYAKGFDYMISRPSGSRYEGDIVIGGGLTKGSNDGIGEFANTDDTVIDPDIEDYLTQSTTTFFGQNWGNDHPDGRVRKCWSGIMGYSADGYPFVGEVPGEEGLWLDVSFQGHGMVLCFLCAEAVTHMILGRDTEDLNSWFPNCFRVTKERIDKKFEGFDVVPDVAEGEPQINGSNDRV